LGHGRTVAGYEKPAAKWAATVTVAAKFSVQPGGNERGSSHCRPTPRFLFQTA
jgi:hypothetical protein